MRPLRRGRKTPRDPHRGSARPASDRRSSASAGVATRRLAAQRAAAAGSALLGLARLLAGALQEIARAIVAGGEAVGRLELRLGRLVSVPLRGMLRAGRAAIAIRERGVTPARAGGAGGV